jgi:hypothetical protein
MRARRDRRRRAVVFFGVLSGVVVATISCITSTQAVENA